MAQVATGDDHSACVTGDGSVYTWGGNGSGQLGQADEDYANLPVVVRALDGNANVN